jgi:hypothetical protein
VSGTEVAKPDEAAATQQLATLAAVTDMDEVARIGLWLAAAESNSADPKARGMAAALRILYAGRLGLPPHAASEVYLIKGNLTLSSKLCRALAHNHGLRVVRVEETPDSCTAAVVTDSGVELGRTRYTLAQAKQAGLGGTNWTSNPDRMLWARASKRALDDHAPWVTVGVVTEEEFQDAELLPAPEPEDTVLEGDVLDPDDDVPFGEDA